MGRLFFPFRVNPFSGGAWCIGEQTGSHKSGLPLKEKWQKLYMVIAFLCFLELHCFIYSELTYSEFPLLRPPKFKTFCQLKTLFAKFRLFVSSFSSPSVSLIRDHLWDCPKVVFKTTFGQSQRWSWYRNFTVFQNNVKYGSRSKFFSWRTPWKNNLKKIVTLPQAGLMWYVGKCFEIKEKR